MTRIACLLSSATQLTLRDGSTVPVGCSSYETHAALERLRAAGVEVTIITPDGKTPPLDRDGLSWYFHTPDEDRSYVASVLSTFARDAEDARVTLHGYADLGLAAARGVAELLRARGLTDPQAHRVVCAAAGVAWRTDRPFAEVVAEQTRHIVAPGQVRRVVDAQRADTLRRADERVAELRVAPDFRHPVDLSSMTDTFIDELDGLFVPGGYGAMVDLSDNYHAGRVVATLHRKFRPIAAVGHGSAILLSAPERADGLWLFDGYRMTSITDDEEDQTEVERDMDWRLDVALKDAGAVFDDGPAWDVHVVIDRDLVTGQNPASTQATVEALLRQLGRQISAPLTTAGSVHRENASDTRSRSPRQTVDEFLRDLGGASIDGVMSWIAPRAAATFHPLPLSGVGADVVRDALSHIVPDVIGSHISVRRVITTGDVVTALFTMSGSLSSGYDGAPDLPKHVALEHAWRFVVLDGLITEIAAYWCQAQLYRRIGVKQYDEVVIA